MDVKNRWVAFDPQNYHAVEEVKSGSRRSIALFSPKNWKRLPSHCLDELIDIGFYPPLSAQSAEASATAADADATALPAAAAPLPSLSLPWLCIPRPLALCLTQDLTWLKQ